VAGGLKDAGPPMYSLLSLISTVIQIYIYILIASAVLSWLIAFNVVNTRNQFVAMLADALYRLTEPALAPIRRILPNFGGLDLSPVVLILLLFFLRNLMFEVFVRAI
jgi:YggT family protein